MKKAAKKKGQWGGKRENQTGRPKIYDEKTITFSVSMPPSLIEKLDTYAESEGVSRSKVLTKIVAEWAG